MSAYCRCEIWCFSCEIVLDQFSPLPDLSAELRWVGIPLAGLARRSAVSKGHHDRCPEAWLARGRRRTISARQPTALILLAAVESR